jgi:hypothetical protein
MSEKRKKYQFILCLWLLLFTVFPAKAAYKPLSESARVSVLFSTRAEFGHAALRVVDPELKIDYVFNYGIIGFDLNYFPLFFKDYPCQMYAVDFQEIEKEDIQAKNQMTELVLNFSPEEKEFLWQSLLSKAKSSPRVLYDVFKGNCTSLPIALIEGSVRGKLLYKEQESHESYLSLLDKYMQYSPWVRLFLDISFGIRANTPITDHEAFFIPDRARKAFLSAEIQDENGNLRPLISDVSVILPGVSEEKSGWFTPWVGSLLLLILVIVSCIIEYRKKKIVRWLDVVLFAFAGLVGIYLFYANFIVDRWYFFPSWWLLCIHPLHLLGAVFCASKRLNRPAYYYHIFNLCAIGVMVVGTCFVPQYYNPAFAVLIGILVLRSAWHVVRRRLAQIK